MCRFIETIRVEKGRPLHVEYHNQRMNDTRLAFWPEAKVLTLTDYLLPPGHSEVMKCRVIYSEGVEEVTYTPYTIRPVQSLCLVCSNTLDYAFKSANRDAINQLYQQKGVKDDVLIVKNGLITDTSIANVAFFDGANWFTPKNPILKGTQRAQLLQRGIIQEKEITVEQLYSFSQISIFNAMIPFQTILIDIHRDSISW
ncbi:aminotransferase class IV family protein [Bacteroides sp.]|uniref:aminotransferase class IV family protein n=1 Tax=Bacteroides sp. TaxID=29523 RepID=UPI001B5B6549|nr:aminotransferase class IV family protein [Bacteroides sp.]MBP6065102.1 aminotransferase class IV [Bacteroides sp.]MBP6066866.1 aminotransferase class IV [Bacteroides sp.]MBP6936204.1 aminotransferase class IV [Bacteroides sp.]MBP8622350.1 aminotransferase class IV [Bacteroides sp.]MBP9506474.1 aminotransferase class IV [Bacteroides sp.]